MSLENPTPDEKKFFETKEDDLNWKDCPFCGGEITQVRKAFFECINCKQGIIADEEDMKRSRKRRRGSGCSVGDGA